MTATSTSWKRESFKEGVAFPYAAEFNSAEFARLRDGLVPRTMEDKWFVYFEEPHLYFHRSWTGQPAYRLKLETTTRGAKVTEALWASDLAASPQADIEYQPKLVDFLLSNLLLGQAKPFPRPSGISEPMPGVFQHHVSGTGYGEVQYRQASMPAPRQAGGKPKKPWWRIW